jgi:hypothetical protein
MVAQGFSKHTEVKENRFITDTITTFTTKNILPKNFSLKMQDFGEQASAA